MGKANQMIVSPNESHVIVKQEYRKDLEDRVRAWFDYYLKGEKPADGIVKGVEIGK